MPRDTEKNRLPAVQALTAKVAVVLETICTADGVVVKKLYCVLTFDPVHNACLGVRRLLETSLIQCWTLDEIYSHPGGLLGKQKC